MKNLIPIFGGLVFGVLVLGVIAWVVASKLGWLKKGGGDGAAGDDGASTSSAPDIGPGYRPRAEVLSAGERAFLPVLREAVAIVAAERRLPVPVIFASVRLAEILTVASAPASPAGEARSGKGKTPGWQGAFNRIASKQVDFVICDPDRTRPLLVVELDDATHTRTDRADRDTFVDRACASAGLPILHIRAAASYPAAYATTLAREITAQLRAGT